MAKKNETKLHDDDTAMLDQAKAAVKGIDTRTAAVAGAGVAAGLAIGAALFANWRKSGQAPGAREPHVDYPADDAALAIGDAPDAVGAAAGAELDPDAGKLQAMGTPTTLPIDGGVQDYTGEREPDMAVDYLPEMDVGSTDAADTRAR